MNERTPKPEAVGFRGLVGLVSDVEGLEERLREIPPPDVPRAAAPVPTPKASVPERSGGRLYIFGFLFLMALLFVYSLGLDAPATSGARSTGSRPPAASSPNPRPQSVTGLSPIPTEPRPTTSRPRSTTFTGQLVEERPPPGTNSILTRAQISYCFAESIRIDAAYPLVDLYSQEEVDRFNAMADDYNVRCAHYRYREGTLAGTLEEVERYRPQIEAEGRRRFGGGP